MYKIAVLAAVVLALSACGSSPKYQAEKPQYCYTHQVMVKDDDGTVASRTVVECNDNQVQRLFQVESGLAPHCGEFSYWMRLRGQDVQRKGISCRRPDGGWEVIDTRQW